MSPVIKGIVTTVVTAVCASLVVGAAWGVIGLAADPPVRKSATSVYLLKVEAEQRFELLAAESETARLETQLEIIKIKLEKYRDLGNVRPLTEGEQIELRSIERERDVILQRLASKG